MSDIIAYITEHGFLGYFLDYRAKGMRLGQAFFNALSNKDKERLRATIADPFYSDSVDKVADAVVFLKGVR